MQTGIGGSERFLKLLKVKRLDLRDIVGGALVALVCLLVAVLAWAPLTRWHKQRRRVHKFMASVPGPASIPFFGNAFFTLSMRSPASGLFQELRRNWDEHPRAAAFWIAGIPYYVTGDRKVFKAISGCLQNVDKTNDYDHFKAHCQGIFTANGEEWRKMRRIMNPSFRASVLQSFDDNFRRHTMTLLDQLAEDAKSGQTFNIFTPVHLCTIDLICENMMASQMNIQKRHLVHLSTDLERSTEMLFEKSFSLLLWSDTVYSLVGKKRRLNQAVKGMRELAHQMLQERIAERKATWSQSSQQEAEERESTLTFMEVLLQSIKSGAVSETHATEEIVEMFIAGSMTTATTVAWAMKILATRPDVQTKLYEELRWHLQGSRRGDEKGDKVQPETEVESESESESCPITLAHLTHLKYLDMVVKETLRHVTVPFVMRHLVRDLHLDDEKLMPAGLRLMLNTFVLHHDAEYWERPGEFYPEHFSTESEATRPKGVFVPFMCGPRICPGYKYALQSVKLLIANMILKYEVTSEEPPLEDFREENYRIMFMLWPSTGFQVRIRERSKKPIRDAHSG